MRELHIEHRLASIERRLAEIEQVVGLARPADVDPLSVLPEPESERDWVPVPAVHATPQPVSPAVSPPPLPSLVERRKTLPPHLNQPALAPTAPALEQTIGLKWAGWVGAVVLTIGAALGVKFAY